MKTSLIWLLGLAVVAGLCTSASATPVPQEEVEEEVADDATEEVIELVVEGVDGEEDYEAAIPDYYIDENDLDDDAPRSIGGKVVGAGIKQVIKTAADKTVKIIKKVIIKGGKKVIKIIKIGSKNAIKQAGKIIKEGGKKVIKGAGKVIKEGGKQVIKGATKVVKEGGKLVIKGAGKIIKEGGKKVVKVVKTQGGKLIIKGVKEAAKVVAEAGAEVALELALQSILSGDDEVTTEEDEYDYEEFTEGENGDVEGEIEIEVGKEGEGEGKVEGEVEGDEEENAEEGEEADEDDVDLMEYVNSDEHCSCTGVKCECCVKIPDQKEACVIVTILKSLWEPQSEIRLATSYGNEKALTMKFQGGNNRRRCTSLPESMGNVKLCMSSEGKQLKKGVQTQCFKFDFNEEYTFSKCLLETKEKTIAIRSI